jgi:hypothetical protein
MYDDVAVSYQNTLTSEVKMDDEKFRLELTIKSYLKYVLKNSTKLYSSMVILKRRNWRRLTLVYRSEQ